VEYILQSLSTIVEMQGHALQSAGLAALFQDFDVELSAKRHLLEQAHKQRPLLHLSVGSPATTPKHRHVSPSTAPQFSPLDGGKASPQEGVTTPTSGSSTLSSDPGRKTREGMPRSRSFSHRVAAAREKEPKEVWKSRFKNFDLGGPRGDGIGSPLSSPVISPHGSPRGSRPGSGRGSPHSSDRSVHSDRGSDLTGSSHMSEGDRHDAAHEASLVAQLIDEAATARTGSAAPPALLKGEDGKLLPLPVRRASTLSVAEGAVAAAGTAATSAGPFVGSWKVHPRPRTRRRPRGLTAAGGQGNAESALTGLAADKEDGEFARAKDAGNRRDRVGAPPPAPRPPDRPPVPRRACLCMAP
jgi:hypothetical protein